ncbi:MAG TPA: hypothetical protein VKG84_08995, partial [Candidatus Acidoferrales bacterium]|nr:hypothetical protein [Candidatus Acidoferrales bacterium]
LLELEDLRRAIGPFDPAALAYPWRHADPRVDTLAAEVQQIVERGEKFNRPRDIIFQRIREAAHAAAGLPAPEPVEALFAASAAAPYLTEPWYCCAEPGCDQLLPIAKAKEAVRRAESFV